MRHAAIQCLTALIASAACGQSATVLVSHNDNDGLVSPGETVRISATLFWDNFLLLSAVEGDLLTTDNLGNAANNAFAHPNAYLLPPVSINPGKPSGGGVEYDWTTTSQLGSVEFRWQGSVISPDPVFFTPLGFVTLPTTYVSTSLTVIPAPASAAAIAAGLTAATPRRRGG